MSLDSPMNESEDSSVPGEFLEDESLFDSTQIMENALLKERIKEALSVLNYREREIVKLRTGLGDGHCYTLEEVGHIFKVTRERIRQIESKAYKKLGAFGNLKAFDPNNPNSEQLTFSL